MCVYEYVRVSAYLCKQDVIVKEPTMYTHATTPSHHHTHTHTHTHTHSSFPKALLDRCLSDDPDTITSYAAIAYKEEKFDDARLKFVEGMNLLGYQPDLAYNIALCFYRMKMYVRGCARRRSDGEAMGRKYEETGSSGGIVVCRCTYKDNLSSPPPIPPPSPPPPRPPPGTDRR